MDYKRSSDQELWKCCQKNDVRAYNILFDRYLPVLYKQAFHYLKSEMDAEELVMDLLFNVWQKRSTLNNMGENVKAYLYRSLHNRIINFLHKKTPGTEPIELIPEYELLDTRAADHDLITKELSIAYDRRISELSPQRKEVFLLSREENLTYRQIAQRMGLSVNTVENHMASALNVLRESTHELTTLSILFALFSM